MLCIDLHFFQHFQDQAVLLIQQIVKQMFLLHLLVSIFIRYLLQIVDCLQRFLGKFINIHKISPSQNLSCFHLFYN